MATQFSEVYSSFLSKVSDYSFVALPVEELEDELYDYLKSSIVDFYRCRTDLSHDKELKMFNEDLTDREVEILSALMVFHYLQPKTLTSDVIEQALTDREIKIYSQANHIESLRILYKTMKKEAKRLINEYTFINGEEDGFK